VLIRFSVRRQRHNGTAHVEVTVNKCSARFRTTLAPIHCRDPDWPDRAVNSDTRSGSSSQTIRFGRSYDSFVTLADELLRFAIQRSCHTRSKSVSPRKSL
jgi:hypothetical protein